MVDVASVSDLTRNSKRLGVHHRKLKSTWMRALWFRLTSTALVVKVDDFAHEVAEGRFGLGDEGQGAAQVESG